MALTRQMLDDYQAKEREIKRLEDKIAYYASYVTPMEHGVVAGSRKEYPYSQCHFIISGADPKSDDARQNKIKELLVMLQERKRHFLDIDIEVGKAIEEIQDAEMRQIIEDKFIRGLTDQEIAKELSYERSAITKKINAFFVTL